MITSLIKNWHMVLHEAVDSFDEAEYKELHRIGEESKKEIEALALLWIDVYAHYELDWEITLNGNGTNTSEAINAINEVMSLLKIKKPKNFNELVSKRVEELKKEQGEYDG